MCISWLALLHGLKEKTHSSSKKIMELTFHWWRNLLMHTNMLPSPYVSVFLCTPHFHYMVTRLRLCIGTMMKLYVWIVCGWFMFVCALMFRSVIGYHHFHWMNMNTTHLLFSHTHSSSEHFFLRTWIAAVHYKWTSKMPANYYGVPLLNLSILSPGCQTDCLRCCEQLVLWNCFH